MGKLGYTWYPKDWGNSESVFELNLTERGLYRELIDLAMLNDNKTEVKLEVWSRKFAIDIDSLKSILGKLMHLDLIKVNGESLFIPSCESRLNLVRGGSKGGKTSKPTAKPTSKPFESLEEKNEKPTPNQIEKKVNIKEKEYKSFKHLSLSISDFEKLKLSYTQSQIDGVLESIENYRNNKNYVSLYLTAKKWLEKEYPKPNNENQNGIGRTNQKIMTYND
jgi:hypothetical protein